MKHLTKTFLCLLIALAITQMGYSQKKSFNITFERNDDKSVTFNYEKDYPGSTFLILEFKQLTNASSRTIKKTIKGYGGRITTLQPVDKNSGIGFSYSYRTITGNINAKPDFDFKYVLPFKDNKEVKVKNLSYLGKKFGNSNPKNWKYFQFLTQPNGTVCAARKGVVVKVKNGFSANDEAEYGFKSESNSILIEHDDGTLANYSVLKKNSFMVSVGDKVYPSTPLALSGTYDKEENSQLRFTVYYLDKAIKDYNLDKIKKQTLENRKHFYAYINPMFYVNDNATLQLKDNTLYTAMCNDAIMQFEMSKREKKRLKKKKAKLN